MSNFRTPRPPFWLDPPQENEFDFYLRDVIRENGHFIENLSTTEAERYTTFLNQKHILYVWNTITYSTIPLPIIDLACTVDSTRMPGDTNSVALVYNYDYGYNISYPFSPIIADALNHYHPIEVCAFRVENVNC